MTLNDSTVSGNSATGDFGTAATVHSSATSDDGVTGDGGGIFNGGGTVTLNDSTVSDNNAGDGGGIFNVNGTVTLNDSTVSGNSVTRFLGFGAVVDSSVTGDGDGIFSNNGTLTLNHSTVSDNSATGGFGETATVQSSATSNGLVADDGGGIFNADGTLTLTGSTVSGNSVAGDGGGIDDVGGTVTLNDSTVSDNTAGGFGDAAIHSTYPLTSGDGGGIYNASGTLALTSTTISGNSATRDGGGIYDRGDLTSYLNQSSNTSVAQGRLATSIVAGNTVEFGEGVDCYTTGGLQSVGHNLIGSSCQDFTPAASDLVGSIASPIEPMLGPLADNGGPTWTQALQPGSPAVDVVPQADLGGITTDQRGLPRPDNGENMADIGAYELQDPAPSSACVSCTTVQGGLMAPFIAVNPPSVTAGQSVTVSGEGFSPGATVSVGVNTGATAGAAAAAGVTTVVSILGTFSTSLPIGAGTAPGVYIVTATDSTGLHASTPLTVVAADNVLLQPAALSGGAGQSIALTGSGFAPGELVSLYLSTSALTPSAVAGFMRSVMAGTGGQLAAAYIVPAVPPGLYLLVGRGQTSERVGMAGFTVTGAASVSTQGTVPFAHLPTAPPLPAAVLPTVQASPSSRYFAEGYTGSAAVNGKVSFTQSLLLFNCGSVPSQVTIRYDVFDPRSSAQTSVVKQVLVAAGATARRSVNQDVGDDRYVSATVHAGAGIVAEEVVDRVTALEDPSWRAGSVLVARARNGPGFLPRAMPVPPSRST